MHIGRRSLSDGSRRDESVCMNASMVSSPDAATKLQRESKIYKAIGMCAVTFAMMAFSLVTG
jgi:hypothetical protein